MNDSLYHFIGIGGIGMSGLARILLQRGKKVSGSDKNTTVLTRELAQEGAKVSLGHDAKNISLGMRVIYSTDICPKTNEEYKEAVRLGLPLFHRAQLLHELMEGSFPLLVAGTHGKTTTSSLLAHVLAFCGKEPSYCIGGVLKNFQTQAGQGKGSFFVAEADESDGSFLLYEPQGAIITNIDQDHLNYWETEENLIQGFVRFQEKVKNKDLLFICADDQLLGRIYAGGTTYGFSSKADIKIKQVDYLEWQSVFTLSIKDVLYRDITIPLVGQHNVLNATAVFGLCLRLGIEEQAIKQAFMAFKGVGRRAEKKGEVNQIAVYDDYGHHPTEIETTLKGIVKAVTGRRVIVLFQPHRFTRTRDCFTLFGPALQPADLIFITDIYSAGEPPIDGITSDTFYRQVVSQSQKLCKYASRDKIVEEVLSCLSPGDVVVSMGAGDITHVGPELLARLAP